MKTICFACGATPKPGDGVLAKLPSANRLDCEAGAAVAAHVLAFSFTTLCLVGCAAASILIGHMTGTKTGTSAGEHAKAIRAALQPGGSMSTPEGFQKACGEANALFEDGMLLDYNKENLSVSFRPDGTVRFGHIWNFDGDPEGTPVDEDWAMGRVHCEP